MKNTSNRLYFSISFIKIAQEKQWLKDIRWRHCPYPKWQVKKIEGVALNISIFVSPWVCLHG